MAHQTSDTAYRFLKTYFEEGDELGAIQRYAHPDFVQHNPEIDNGIAGYTAYHKNRAPVRSARVVNLIMMDDESFAVHHHGFHGPDDRGRVTVDIWRVAEGKVAEHWDVIQEVPETILHSNTMWCAKGSDYASAKALGNAFASPAGGNPDKSADPRASVDVLEAYLISVGDGDVKGSIERWFAPDYIQHSPHIADGVRGAIDYLTLEFGVGDRNKPTAHLSHVIADGDLVLHHRHVTRPEGPKLGNVQADIFRITNRKISEHWDVKQLVPARSLNGNPMW